jgi:putative toxin-antitoxin system antitoxin component (TIGR02293 family)
MRSSIAHVLSDAPVAIIRRTRLGFPATAIRDVSDVLGISKRQLCDALRIRRRTTNIGRSSEKALTIDEGDRLLRVLRVLERASDVLGSKTSGRQWLCTEIRSLGGVQPLSLLDTGVGYSWVMDTLGRIEHGIAA